MSNDSHNVKKSSTEAWIYETGKEEELLSRLNGDGSEEILVQGTLELLTQKEKLSLTTIGSLSGMLSIQKQNGDFKVSKAGSSDDYLTLTPESEESVLEKWKKIPVGSEEESGVQMQLGDYSHMTTARIYLRIR